MIHEIVEKVIELGFDEIENINSRDQFGYTS